MGDMNLPRFFLVQKLVNEWRIGAIFTPTKKQQKTPLVLQSYT